MSWPALFTRTKDWGTEILTDADLEGQFDLIGTYINDMMNSSTGHKHDGTTAEGPQIATGGIANDAITFTLIDDDGDFGLFTGDWSFNEIALVEDTAPSTAASEMKLYTKDTSGQPELFVREESDGDEIQLTSGGFVGLVNGNVVQVVNTQDGAVATGTTAIPIDDTIPQNTEGDEYMTLAITPKSTTNKLKIEVVVFGASTGTSWSVGLFQDSTADALAGGTINSGASSNAEQIMFTHYMAAGTISSTTFKVRVGGASGTFTFNGFSGARKLGGVAASSITITEIQSS